MMCNVYLASDVACSTASILNLLAISLDRYPICHLYLLFVALSLENFLSSSFSLTLSRTLSLSLNFYYVHILLFC